MNYVRIMIFTLLIAATFAQEVFDGLLLFTPVTPAQSTEYYSTFLMQNDESIINEWRHPTRPSSIAYLLPDSTLLYPTTLNGRPGGGKIIRYDWYGNILWEYQFTNSPYSFHHDIEPLPNGNILLLAWEIIPIYEAISLGRTDINSDMWPEVIIEIEPLPNNNAQIVWQWHAWDHLIQNVNPELPNYGELHENPQRLNINMGALGGGHQNNNENGEWFHANSIHYNELLDQIVISSRHLNELYIIDHSTSTEEAASSIGGNSGKGGDILYRWGNPENYGIDNVGYTLNAQHSVNWIEYNYMGGGNLIIFNNIAGFNYSEVIEIELPINEENNYYYDLPYLPLEPLWQFNENEGFYCNTQSGAFRLPNGNTIVTVQFPPRIFEVTYDGNIIWDYYYENQDAKIPRAQKYSFEYLTGSQLGDLNYDGVLNILDIVIGVAIILESNFNINFDMNHDNILNVLDVVILVNMILNSNE